MDDLQRLWLMIKEGRWKMIAINKFKRLCYPQVNTNVNIRDFKLNCLQNKKFVEDTAKNRKTKSVIFKDEFETELAKK